MFSLCPKSIHYLSSTYSKWVKCFSCCDKCCYHWFILVSAYHTWLLELEVVNEVQAHQYPHRWTDPELLRVQLSTPLTLCVQERHWALHIVPNFVVMTIECLVFKYHIFVFAQCNPSTYTECFHGINKDTCTCSFII